MAQTQTIAPLELIINRTFNVPRERVFRAWTETAELDRWFSPSLDFKIKSSIDLRVGGKYRIEMHKNDGQVFSAFGVYREIQRPQRLVFTWKMEGATDIKEDTLVTVEFFEDGDKTHVTLKHQNFLTAEVRERHEQGWRGCMDHLEQVL